MALRLEELATIRFEGERTVDHALELTALKALTQFKILLNKTAAFIFERSRLSSLPSKRRTQEKEICVYLRKLEPGSTVVHLEVDADTMRREELRGSLALMSQVFTSLPQGKLLPTIPTSLAKEFAKFTRALAPRESLQVTGAWNTNFQVTFAMGEPFDEHVRLAKETSEYPEIPLLSKRLEVGSLETILQALAAEVPLEEWQKLPSDLTDHLDHYLYGTPKK
jgi:hypothetical protein